MVKTGTGEDHSQLAVLEAIFADLGEVAVAVSGGVDSLTLATVAAGVCGSSATMYHAVSPAVPAEATARTRGLAAKQGWLLKVCDAGEFADAEYRNNPVNRCFFCKTNLYSAIAQRTNAQIVSGTNRDDLGEYRPGLEAAREYRVRHPFVEAGIGKREVRRLAAALGLGDIAELPASPCLSSRIETGIRIEAPLLSIVHDAEQLVAAELAPRTVRCRIRAAGVVIELDDETLSRLDEISRKELKRRLTEMMEAAGVKQTIAFGAYRTGSAFLTETIGASPDRRR
jgi:pyridinium-3,5-biscarboxylic acid mononucleotide sulfurtransferase